MTDDTIFDGLRQKLDEFSYPTSFLFKFIFPVEQLQKVKSIFKKEEHFEYRPSTKGTYLSLTCNANVQSTDEIIDIYKKAAQIKGVISL